VLRAALPSSERLDAVSEEELTGALLASLRFDTFADVRPALRAARSEGSRLLVVSNWDFSLHEVLSRLSLTDLLDGVVTSAEVGARKPARAIFERALALAGARPQEAVHIGDSLEEDVEGARAAGIRPVLLRRGGEAGLPGVQTITTLAELA
jgi:putative hydrolase of the HAD superfamily